MRKHPANRVPAPAAAAAAAVAAVAPVQPRAVAAVEVVAAAHRPALVPYRPTSR